jgi:glycosyltransferase involved in cell wall biosynthesis
MKIYDCSNSSSRPAHRGYGGQVENACVSLLKKHATRFNCEFVDTIDNADVVFTNDVFPEYILKSNIPLVKRMDGIFWQLEYRDRNLAYNEAAMYADHVIFTSEYSRRAYYEMYGDLLKCESVALNWVDTSIFYPDYRLVENVDKWIAVATSWERFEKCKKDIYSFAKMLEAYGSSPLQMVGTLDESPPHNIVSHGYIEDPKVLAQLLRNADALINLSYRDASPKVVAEAVSCGLPVLYANSGGVQELVPYGIGINPIWDKYSILTITSSFNCFRDSYLNMRRALLRSNEPKRREAAMLNHYFEVFKEVANY